MVSKNSTVRWGMGVLVALVVSAESAPSSAAQRAANAVCVLIVLDAQGRLTVDRDLEASGQLAPGAKGLIVWTDLGREDWRFIPQGGNWKAGRIDSGEHRSYEALAGTRGGVASGQSEPSVIITAQLDQILGQTVVRGTAFVTPHNGAILNPKINIRRSPLEGEQKFPAAVALLLKGKHEIARIAFNMGQQKLTYDEIPELAKTMPDGLPAGEYYLKMADAAASAQFTIEDNGWRNEVLSRPDRFAKLTGSRANPLYLQIAVEHFLDQKDKDNQPSPYLSDALDVLEAVPEKALTVHLKQLKGNLLDRLSGKKPAAGVDRLETTGIAAIDDARQSVALGNWKKAIEQLDPRGLPAEPRARALASLYRGIVQSESGLGTADQAALSFDQAFRLLEGGSAPDLFLVLNNVGNHDLNQAQDRLYNHAFLMATGGVRPVMSALTSWIKAEKEYRGALEIARKLGPGQEAAARVNCSRLYVVLADLIRTLDVPAGGKRAFADGEQAAAERAAQFAAEASAIPHIEPVVLAAAEENRAHLAFRASRSGECVSHARKALDAYLDAGSLTGAEGIHRLLGLSALRHDEFDRDGKVDPGAAKTALEHFLISAELAEILRDRIPDDQIGLSQAGFFARRAYVNENIIELLIGENRPDEALHYAELASARSLQDLLVAARAASSATDLRARTTAEMLASWPKKVAALKYFIGTRKVWLFVIDTKGRVRAHDLLGTKETSRQFVADVSRYIRGIDLQLKNFSTKMSTDGFGQSWWQDELHDFFETLIPRGVLEQLRSADVVVVAPHHVLHYFPFAALVTRRDSRKRGPEDMVEPRFLVDEPFHLIHEPSLAVWDALQQRPDTPLRDVQAMGIVDFANPGSPQLLGVGTDIKNLKDIFGDRVRRVLFGAEADKASVLKMLARPGMVFFGTHGLNRPDRPLETKLVVHGGQRDDSLTAREIFAIRVRSDLIVMSACETGLADRSPLPGDDLFGIQRAFLQSGARTVLSGLWNVPEVSGPDLMNVFFRNLAKGESAAAALADSQRTFLKQRRGAKDFELLLQVLPMYWAVYAVAGDQRARFAR